MEEIMKKIDIPKTDSINELAVFWDTHDLTDFENKIEEVEEPVFERKTILKIHLQHDEAEELIKLARSKGISYDDLIREWVLERINAA